ncbi:MAG: hypothetical protein ACYDC5_13825, partial [Candidatus Dormibacteria bacterium]
MPEATLLSFGKHGTVGALLQPDHTLAEGGQPHPGAFGRRRPITATRAQGPGRTASAAPNPTIAIEI